MRQVHARSDAVLRRSLFRRILVAVDQEENAQKAVRVASGIAAQNGAELSIVHFATFHVPLIPPPGVGLPPVFPQTMYETYFEDSIKAKRRWASKLVAIARDQGVDASSRVVLAERSAAEDAATLAERENMDLIVVGAEDAGRLRRLLEGTFSRAILDHAGCPVLVVV